MAERAKALGRGLAALMETDGEPRSSGSEGMPLEVDADLIARNPDQPRKTFDEAELDALAESIREKGVLQPILVRPKPGGAPGYQIVAGERRWRAAQRAGLTRLPVLIRSFDDLEVLEVAVVENVQRSDLNPVEEAEGYRALIDRFGRTQDMVAKAVGKSRSHVANALRLLALPSEVLTMLTDGRLSAGHARAIAAARDPSALAERIASAGLNVRQAEALARAASTALETKSQRPAPMRPRGAKSTDTLALEEDLQALLGLVVAIDDSRGRGEIRVRYETLEQLDDVCRRLSKPA